MRKVEEEGRRPVLGVPNEKLEKKSVGGGGDSKRKNVGKQKVTSRLRDNESW